MACTIVRSLVVQHGGEPRLLNAVMAVTDAHGAPLLDLSFFEALYVPVDPPGGASSARSRGRASSRGPRRSARTSQARLIFSPSGAIRASAPPPNPAAEARAVRPGDAT